MTEAERIEEALRESEARLHRIAKAGRIGLFEWNASKDTAYWSQEHYELFGFEPGSPVSWERWLQGVHPEDRERVVGNASRLLEHARSEGEVQGHKDEYRYIRPDEFVVWIEADLSADMVGGEIIVRGSVRDITERKRAEEALNKSEKQLKHIIENSMDVAYRRDLLTDRFDYISPVIESITGFTVAEMKAMSSDDMVERVHLDDLDIAYKKFGATLKGGHCVIEYRFRCKDGKYRWISDSINILVDSNGNPVYRIGVVRDIADRKRAEESEERLKALMDHNPSLVFLKDESGRYVYLNKAYERQFALSKDWYGKTDFDFWPKESAELFQRNDSEVLRSGEIHQFLEDSTDLEGKRHCWLNYKFPFIDSNNERYLGGIGIDTTDRIIAEEALRESEERYRSLFDSMTEGFALHEIICDEKGDPTDYRFLDINPAFEQLTGLNKADVIGRTHNEVLPDDDPRWVREYGAVALTGNPVQIENYSPALKRRYEVFAYCPTPGKFATVFMDITERKKAEEALRESEERLHSMAENVPCVLMRFDRQLRVVYLSKQSDRYNPNPVERMIGRTNREMGMPEHLCDLWDAAIERVFRTGKQEEMEFELTGPSGMRTFDLKFAPEFGPNHQVQYVLGVSSDITERKRAEKALQDSKERLALALSAGRLATWDWPMTIDEMTWNDQNFRMMGYEPGEVKPSYRAWIDRVHPDDRSNAQAVHERSRELGGDFTNEFRALWPDGTVRWLEARGHLNLDAKGQPLRSFGVMIDMTERKEAEEQLANAKMLLEQKVKERTDDLSLAKKKLEIINQNLIEEIKAHSKARDAAEAAARAKSEFLANMSHEIRTPMNAIIGMTDLILDEPMNPVQRENLQLVRTNGDALLAIINDILDFSKMESDKLLLEEYEFDLRQCVEEALDLIALKAADKGLNLAYTIDKNVPDTIIGDPGRLRQVLGNLLSNAVKFTDEGNVTVSVYAEGPDEIHFAVQDTGIGIPQGSMHQLFQSFNQMEPSTSRLYGGTGLGLAISKKLVELMGGKIWAESEDGKGSIFHFTIKAPSGQHRLQTMAVLPQMIGRHVLIVEDNKINRRILSKQAYDWGMIPVAAVSGREALNWISRGDNFDIAIVDMDLNDISGLELEDEIRKYNKTLPLVLLTSLGKKIPSNHAYLTKPIKPSLLYKVLIDILQKDPTKRSERQVLAGQPIQSHALRILLAEDNTSHQKVAQQMLRKLGYKADVVANGMEALHALERRNYDVVFMDVKMPVMDGLEATKIIRQRWPQGPKIIAITAFALEGDRERFIEAGMDDYISKPVQKEDLANVLAKHG